MVKLEQPIYKIIFFKNRNLLNIYYPNTFQKEESHLYLSSINKKNFVIENWKTLQKEIKNIQSNILISSEEFIYDKKFINNLNLLEELFQPRQIKIILTIDFYVNQIYKSYLEFIKKYENEYVSNDIYLFIKNHKNSFIQNEIKKIISIIGNENVILVPYQKNNYINIFCKYIGIELNNLQINENRKLNSSVKIEYLNF